MDSRRRDEAFPWKALKHSMGQSSRANVASVSRLLLAWQRRLERWPRVPSVPDATPFVTLYAGGRLAGCVGSSEGTPSERLARAFIGALEDGRYGGVQAKERENLTACVSYLQAPTRRSLAEIEREFELGTQGLAGVVSGRKPALLLPSVAADEGADTVALLHILALKLGVTPAELKQATLYTFEADTVVARTTRPRSRKGSPDAIEAAAGWLAAQVDPRGQIRFALDARARTEHMHGEFLHGRAAVVVQALAAHGGYPRELSRARGWLRAEVRAALSGRKTPDWPEDRARAAGSVALAVLGGVDLMEDLVQLAAAEPLKRNPWHAAQVVAALGLRAPLSLWEACVTNLRDQPWAPWTGLAAHALGDTKVANRVTGVLAASIRKVAPHRGAANVTHIPEIALTAVAVEALAPSRSSAARAATARATSFLRSVQFLGERVPAPLDPAMAHGAFPLSVIVDGLRSDVVAHVLLALLAAGRVNSKDLD